MKKNNSKNIGNFWKTKRLAFFLLFYFSTTILFSQENNEQLKRLQRSIFIFNFAEQIVWKNSDQKETFNIGVLGKDRTVIDLKSLSLKRKIKNKSVLVSNFTSINNIGNIQLLYVNKSSNYNIDEIIATVTQQNILLITEDYDYNSSMINMINVGNTFEYEINTGHILNADLKYATSLKSNAVSSSQRWKELYQTTENALKNEKQKSDLQKETINEELKKIKTQEIKIDTFSKRISKQNSWIKELKDENEIQQKKFEEKIVIEAELEKRIKNKIDTITIQENLMELTKKQIDSQKIYLHNLGEEIAKKDIFLKQKIAEVNVYKRINWLLVAIASLLFLIGLLIFINYRSKLKLTKILEAQNESIEKQSKALEFKNKELEQFAYITSHDLKEPLITITGMINLFIDDYGKKLDETGKMTLNFINESSERMRNLIDSLLEYSKLGRTQEAKDINTNILIESLKNDLNNVIVRTNATVTAKNLPVIKGTEFEIRLLFQNLISNGIKFIDAKTKPNILIDCKKNIDPIHEHQGVYEFSIKDNGIGIEEKHKERIFSIFQRLHSREEYEGTGIGLAHCKKIIEAHGGSIWLTSQLGKGTTFYFTIPYDDTM